MFGLKLIKHEVLIIAPYKNRSRSSAIGSPICQYLIEKKKLADQVLHIPIQQCQEQKFNWVSLRLDVSENSLNLDTLYSCTWDLNEIWIDFFPSWSRSRWSAKVSVWLKEMSLCRGSLRRQFTSSSSFIGRMTDFFPLFFFPVSGPYFRTKKMWSREYPWRLIKYLTKSPKPNATHILTLSISIVSGLHPLPPPPVAGVMKRWVVKVEIDAVV